MTRISDSNLTPGSRQRSTEDEGKLVAATAENHLPEVERTPVGPFYHAKPARVGCVLLSLFCSMFLIAGFLATMPITKRVIRNKKLVNTGVRTHGKVIDYKMSSGKAGRIWPVVSFAAADGTSVQFESLCRLRYSGYSMGQSVAVVYDQKDPKIAEIDEPERLWSGIVSGYLGCSLFMIVGGGGMAFFLRNGFRRRETT